jgi:nucleoside-diphosphate-sugar epimerase
MNKNSQILLIGHKGYIGSRLYHHMKFKDFDIDGYDVVDINNPMSQDFDYSRLKIEKYSTIILLAGHSSVNMTENVRPFSFDNNVTFFYRLCDKLSDQQKLIYASSASVYGFQDHEIEESGPLNGALNHYDFHKQTIDSIANFFINKNKKIVGLRFGTVCGFSTNFRTDVVINSMYYHAINEGLIYIKNRETYRSILGMTDLVNVIEVILNSDKLKLGQYNVSSFNISINNLAIELANKLKVKILELPDDEIVYSFKMVCDKFCYDYGFRFSSSIDSIIQEIDDNYELIESLGNRN